MQKILPNTLLTAGKTKSKVSSSSKYKAPLNSSLSNK